MAIPKEIQSAFAGTSFRMEIEPVRPRLILSVESREKEGKTHFSFTAPDPIAYMSIDAGDEGVIQKFPDKVILPADYEFRVPSNVNREDAVKATDAIRADWEKFTRDYRVALKAARTVVWDTASEVWEMMRIARLGKLDKIEPFKYGPVNSEFREMIRLAYQSNTNLILLHKTADEWSSEGKTGKDKRKGMSEVGFLAQASVRLRHIKAKRNKDGSVIEGTEHRYMDILDSRHRPEVAGSTQENFDFPMLASLLCPDINPEVWK